MSTDSNLNYPKTTIGYGRSRHFFQSIILSGAVYDEVPANGVDGADGYEATVMGLVKGNIVQTKFTVLDGSDIYVSFNGTDDHCHFVGDIGSRKEYIYPHLNRMKFWFRGTGTIEIEYYVE